MPPARRVKSREGDVHVSRDGVVKACYRTYVYVNIECYTPTNALSVQ